MAQTRYHNYKRPIVSLDENARITSLLPYGTYGGFDTLTPVSGNQVSIGHLVTGNARTNLNGTTTPRMGCLVTKQGVVIYEDQPITINVDFNPGGDWRIDLLVCTHIFIDSEGGAPATYSVLKDFSGTITPYMIVIGRIFVPPGAANHSGTKYEKYRSPVPGGGFGIPLPAINANYQVPADIAILNDFNKLDHPGMYFISTTLNRPSSSTADWFVIVMKKDLKIVQMAQAMSSGKVYSRSTTGASYTGPITNPVWPWSPWQNLNNTDVPAVDLSPLWAAIGDRAYTEDNFVTDGQSLTASIDALDQVVEDHENSISAILTNITNILTMIGDLNYPSNNIVTDGTSATTAIGALDAAVGTRNYTNGANYHLVDGETITASLERLNIATPKVKWLGSEISLAIPADGSNVDIVANTSLPGITLGFWCVVSFPNNYPNTGVLSYRNPTLDGNTSYNLLRQLQGHYHTGASGGGALAVNTAFEFSWFCPLRAGDTGRFAMGHYVGSGCTATVKIRAYV